VNFTLNFTSAALSSVTSMNRSLLLAYSAVQIPANYISNLISFSAVGEVDGFYFCDVFSRIDARDKSQAYSYQDQINSDPDSVDRSKFAAFLDEILEADAFDISIPRMDIVAVESSSGAKSDTTEIVIWFLGVSAVCAVGALLLIVCWRKFSREDGELDNGINLEFLLDPNGGHQMDPNSNLFTSPMHIEPDADEAADAQQYHSLQVDVEDDDEDDLEPVVKKKAKIKYFSRLDDGTTGTGAGGDEDAGNDGDDDHANEEEQYEEEDTDDEEADALANPLMDDYEPPNFSRI